MLAQTTVSLNYRIILVIHIRPNIFEIAIRVRDDLSHYCKMTLAASGVGHYLQLYSSVRAEEEWSVERPSVRAQ